MRNLWSFALTLCVSALLATSPAVCQSIARYDASLNSVPEAQGWLLNDDGNPAHYVSGGLLFADSTVGNLSWGKWGLPFSLANLVLEARLRVVSSNYVPTVGDGTREGYYLEFTDAQANAMSIGLASEGFNINTGLVPYHPLTPYPIAGDFHTYRLEITNGRGAFSIDGTIVQRDIAPYLNPYATTSGIVFGAASGFARSVTWLDYVKLDVPQTPPSVTCAATPDTLWPPDGKSASVTISGVITPGTQVLPPAGTTYSVTDKYRQVQPSGGVSLDDGGHYTVAIPLVAARIGGEKDGRTYIINVLATDRMGNVGSCSALVTVPHDQRK